MCLFRTCSRQHVLVFLVLKGMLRFRQKHILIFIVLYRKYAIIGSAIQPGVHKSRFSLIEWENFTHIFKLQRPDIKIQIFISQMSITRHYCISVTDIVFSRLFLMCVFLSFQTNETRFKRKHSPSGSTNI